MQKKRIAIITHGGIGTGPNAAGMPVAMRLVEGLSITYDITVYSLEKFNPTFTPKNFVAKSVQFKTRLFIKMFWLSCIILKDHLHKPYQIFHGLWGFPGGLIATCFSKFLRKKVAVTFKGAEVIYLPEINYGLFNKTWQRSIIKYVGKNADCIIAQSNFHAQKIKDAIVCRRLEIIPGGVDNAIFSSTIKEAKTPFQLLHVANINQVKDQATLLKTFQLISMQVEAALYIIGADTLNGTINNLAKEMGLQNKVHFQGLLTQQELILFYKKAAIFLLTSLSESQAVVVNEAMASGCVVCGTRVGLLADLENKATIAVDIKDAEDLAKKVLNVLNDKNLYTKLQQEGYNYTTKFDINWTIKSYSNLYESMLKKKLV